MKKIVAVVSAIILLGIFLSACKVHESCSAYPHKMTKIEKVKSDKPV